MKAVSGSLEVDRTDEGLVSKTSAGQKPVVGSIPTASAKKEPVPPAGPTYYKLYLRAPNGTMRTDLSQGVLYEMGKDWGDLLHIIPSNRWSTLEDIIQIVWNAEKRNPFALIKRSRKQIEDGVGKLVEARILLTK